MSTTLLLPSLVRRIFDFRLKARAAAHAARAVSVLLFAFGLNGAAAFEALDVRQTEPQGYASSSAPEVFSGAVTPKAMTQPFTHYADGSDVKAVLSSFARAEGFFLDVDPAVEGTVSGRFTRVAPEAFLSAMGEAYGLGWYVLGDVLYVYRLADVRQEFLTIPKGSSADMLASLARSGFVARELPVRSNERGDVLVFRGPPRYVDAIRAAADAHLALQSEKIVMRVFPIKHAWADDITLDSMDRSVTVPGVATILRGMVMGQTVSGRTVSDRRSPTSVPSVPALGNAGVSRQGEYREREAAKAQASVENPVESGTVSIMADPRVNAVLVSDALYRMPYYEEVIRALDKPVELVEIHAAIVDVDANASRELGVDLSGRGGSGGNWQGGGSLGGGGSGDGPSVPVSGTGGALISTIYTHGTDYFMARINALEEENAARMLGRPSVLTIDNVEAVLENTTSYYIPLRGTEAVDLYKVDSGTVLRVTPHVIRENGRTTIKLAVNVQDDQNDSSGGYQSIGGEDAGEITVNPIKQTRINTQAMVAAGQSLLIGGYYYEQASATESGVPVLKDIPVLGRLFQTSSKSGRQMERLILITPRLVTADGENVPQRVKETPFRRSPTDPEGNRTAPTVTKIELSDLSEVWPEGRGDASDVLLLETSADDRKGVAP